MREGGSWVRYCGVRFEWIGTAPRSTGDLEELWRLVQLKIENSGHFLDGHGISKEGVRPIRHIRLLQAAGRRSTFEVDDHAKNFWFRSGGCYQRSRPSRRARGLAIHPMGNDPGTSHGRINGSTQSMRRNLQGTGHEYPDHSIFGALPIRSIQVYRVYALRQTK